MTVRECSGSRNKCTLILSESAVGVDNGGIDTKIMHIYFQVHEIITYHYLHPQSCRVIPEPPFISKENKMLPDMNRLTEMCLAY